MLRRIILLAVIGAFVWLTGANFLWAGSIGKFLSRAPILRRLLLLT